MPTPLATDHSYFFQRYEATLSVDSKCAVREWMYLKEAGKGSEGLRIASTSNLDS